MDGKHKVQVSYFLVDGWMDGWMNNECIGHCREVGHPYELCG
jgi:hypothetical protein